MTIDISALPERYKKQALRKLGEQGTKVPQNKYRNTPTEIDGITFQSKKEAARYSELMVLLRAGEISDLRLQPEFTLQEGFRTIEGKKIQAIKYVADFSYRQDGQCIIEDVKSEATRKIRTYRIKRKMMVDKGLTVREE